MQANVESEVGISSIVNEGPLTREEVENSMTLTLNQPKLIGEIRFNPEQTQNESDIPEVFLEAFESPDSKAKRIWEELKKQESLTPEMTHRAYIIEVLQAQGTQPETKAANGHSYSLPQPGYNYLQVEKAIKKQEILFEKKTNKTPHVVVEERNEVKKKRFVLDERALGVVIVEISAAVRKAAALAHGLGIKITGSLIDRFLPGQHPGNESEAVKGKGPDGSIEERAEDIKNHGEFATDVEADSASIKVAEEKPPVKIREEGEGEPVKDEDVYRVFQRHAVKPHVTELDLSERLTATKVEVITEPRIEDYPDLAEVFKPKIFPN